MIERIDEKKQDTLSQNNNVSFEVKRTSKTYKSRNQKIS